MTEAEFPARRRRTLWRLTRGVLAGYLTAGVLMWLYVLYDDPSLRNAPGETLLIALIFGAYVGAFGIIGGVLTLGWLYARGVTLKWWAGPAIGALVTAVFWPIGLSLYGWLGGFSFLMPDIKALANLVYFAVWGAVSGGVGWLAAFGTRTSAPLA